MNQRVIECAVRNEYVSGAGIVIGAAGSHDEVLVELDFRDSPLWHGTTKTATWTDALGENPTNILLTAQLLSPGRAEVYLVPVPAAAKAVAGEPGMTVTGTVIRGEKEVVRIVTQTARFQVLPSELVLYTGGADIPASAVEQMQAQLDTILEDIEIAAQAVAAGEAAALSAQQAAASEEAARGYADGAGMSETQAREQAELAAEQANRAQAEADRATIPAAAGVYNVILADRVTGGKYALIVEDGRLVLLGVSEMLDAVDVVLVDNATGVAAALVVDGGRLSLEEV